jgi:transcriptional regulator with XRE-family HTH domain
MSETSITQKDIALGKRIRRLRKQVGLTQEKLAEKIKVSTTHVGLVETGKRRFSLKTLQRVATALGIKLKDLF